METKTVNFLIKLALFVSVVKKNGVNNIGMDHNGSYWVSNNLPFIHKIKYQYFTYITPLIK